VKVAAPAPAAWVIAPDCVIAPVESTVKVPLPTLDVPSVVATELVSDDVVGPAVVQLDRPRQAFAWLSVIALAPAALNVGAPAPAAWVIAPVCVIAPVAFT
jgi:hypothetical protein